MIKLPAIFDAYAAEHAARNDDDVRAELEKTYQQLLGQFFRALRSEREDDISRAMLELPVWRIERSDWVGLPTFNGEQLSRYKVRLKNGQWLFARPNHFIGIWMMYRPEFCEEMLLN